MTLEELMNLANAGDKKAYETLLVKVLPMARGYVVKRLHQKNAVEDVVQEILISLHQARGTFAKGNAFEPWFFAICRYRMLDHLRQTYRRDEHESPVDIDDLHISSNENVTEAISNNELVHKALKKLNTKQQKIVWMMKAEGFSASEVALKMNMSVSAVKVSAHRAYKVMKKYLEQNDA